MKYSSNIISKIIKSEDGSEKVYKAQKMSSMTVVKEGFRLIKAITPSIGTGIDSLVSQQNQDDLFQDQQSHTFGAMFQLLSENISDEHFEDLVTKVMGSLRLGDDVITDLDTHFDTHSGDFIEVLSWLLKENFVNFIMGSGTLVSSIDKLLALMSPKMKDVVENFKKSLEEEFKEK
jgi:hypothetical protein